MDYKSAKKIADEYMKINEQLKLSIVGSLAREEPVINDIDFVTTLNLPNDKKYYKTNFKGVPIDIWKVENREVGKLMRTLGKVDVIKLHKQLKERGMKMTPKGVIDLKTNSPIHFIFSGGKIEKSTFIQAILFDKNKWSIKEAKKWFNEHDYKMPFGKEVHVTDTFIRFRVKHPKAENFNYRTKWISKDQGIKAIIGYPK